MKKRYILPLLGFFFASNAQEIRQEDGLRYGVQNLTGTARFSSMSGAFGAVGGDLSAINVNPAGSAIFNNNYGSITASNFNNSNKTNYFGTQNKDTYGTLDLNQIGGVFVFEDNSGNNNWSKIAVGINYENTNNFDNEIFISGLNPNHSISQYFVDYANFDDGTDFNYYQYEMGYDTYILNVDENDNTQFVSNVPAGGNYRQKNTISTTGYNGKLTGNFATSYKDKLYLGINFNAHFTDYVRTTRLLESNNNPSNPSSQASIRNIEFNNQLSTYGTGFSLNVGAIYKINDAFRLGAAYESPTWYRLNDELIQDLYTDNNENVPAGSENLYYGSPSFIFPTYKLKTPGKITGSAAYIYKNIGLISLDIAYKDYSQTTFKPKNESVYQDLNSANSNLLTNAVEIRLGGEYKIKQWSLRAGYRFEESPYKVDYAMGDLTGYSGGIGYNFGESKLDLAYANSHRNYNQYLISSGMNDTARIRNVQNNVTLTYSINF